MPLYDPGMLLTFHTLAEASTRQLGRVQVRASLGNRTLIPGLQNQCNVLYTREAYRKARFKQTAFASPHFLPEALSRGRT